VSNVGIFELKGPILDVWAQQSTKSRTIEESVSRLTYGVSRDGDCKIVVKLQTSPAVIDGRDASRVFRALLHLLPNMLAVKTEPTLDAGRQSAAPGVPKDEDAANRYFARLESSTNVERLLQLVLRCNWNAPMDIGESLRWCRRCAELSDVRSFERSVSVTRRGSGLRSTCLKPRDSTNARRTLRTGRVN
jgi:hypothetical protein